MLQHLLIFRVALIILGVIRGFTEGTRALWTVDSRSYFNLMSKNLLFGPLISESPPQTDSGILAGMPSPLLLGDYEPQSIGIANTSSTRISCPVTWNVTPSRDETTRLAKSVGQGHSSGRASETAEPSFVSSATHISFS